MWSKLLVFLFLFAIPAFGAQYPRCGQLGAAVLPNALQGCDQFGAVPIFGDLQFGPGPGALTLNPNGTNGDGKLYGGGLTGSQSLQLSPNASPVSSLNTGRLLFNERVRFMVPTQTITSQWNWILTGPGGNTVVDTMGTGSGVYEVLTHGRELSYTAAPPFGIAPLFMSWPANVRVKVTGAIDGGPVFRMGANWIADGVAALVQDTKGLALNGAFLDNRIYSTANGGTYNASSDAVGFTAAGTFSAAFPQYIGFLSVPGTSSNLTTAIGFDSRATSAGTTNIGYRTAVVAGSGNFSFQDTGGAQAQFSGPLLLKGSAPTCGAGCSSLTGTDRAFKVTTGTSVTSVTVNFSATLSSTPVCLVDEGTTTSAGVSSVSTSAVTITTSSVTSATLFVMCFQNS